MTVDEPDDAVPVGAAAVAVGAAPDPAAARDDPDDGTVTPFSLAQAWPSEVLSHAR